MEFNGGKAFSIRFAGLGLGGMKSLSAHIHGEIVEGYS